MNLERGRSGLFYVTDPECSHLFIAATTAMAASQIFDQAREKIVGQIDLDAVPEIEGHQLVEPEGSYFLVLIPKLDAQWTPEQRKETVTLMEAWFAREPATAESFG